MKTLKFAIAIIICITSLSSCILFRRAMEKEQQLLSNGRQTEPTPTFVMKRDSTLIPYDGLKTKSPLFGKAKFILDKELTILAKDVLAYQTEDAYYTNIPLTSWSPRINLAAISKYRGIAYENRTTTTTSATGNTSTSSSARPVITYFIQKQNGSIMRYTHKNLYSMIQDNESSLAIMDDFYVVKKKYSKIGTINNLVCLSGFILASIGSKPNSSNAVGGVGTGMILGSIVSGFINRPKKRRNNKKIELTYEDYNNSMKSIIK